MCIFSINPCVQRSVPVLQCGDLLCTNKILLRFGRTVLDGSKRPDAWFVAAKVRLGESGPDGEADGNLTRQKLKSGLHAVWIVG